MLSPSDLPVELTLNIVERLSPEDCFHFAATNHANWGVCWAIISAQKKLAEEYRSWTPREDQALWNLFNSLLENDDIAYHVREVQINASMCSNFDGSGYGYDFVTADDGRPPRGHVVRYMESLRLDPIVSKLVDKAVMDFQQRSFTLNSALENGYEDAMIAILLIRLPMLRTVRFTPGFDDLWTDFVLYQVALAYASPTPMLHLPFQHLTTACVAHSDTENCITWRWALYLLRIPTLRTFSAHMMGGGVDDDDGASITDELVLSLPSEVKSNVMTLNFTESMIDLRVMEHIIGLATNLKEFQYHCGGANVSMDTNHNPKGMISSLLKHCSHSLEKLVMLGEYDGLDVLDEYSSSVSLRGFERLRILQCKLYYLIPDSEDGTPPFELSTVLPTSLEFLDIQCYHITTEHFEILGRTVDSRTSTLPNLKQIYALPQIWSNMRAQPKDLDALVEKATATGLAWKELPDIYKSEYHYFN